MKAAAATSPAVSVIVPVYNKEASLARCLDSLLAQTLSDFEVICVDDGSSDGSQEIAERYARTDARITTLRHDRNRGAGAARNTGLDHARGRYVAFVDADDSLVPQALEKAWTKGCAMNADAVVYDLEFCRSEEPTSPGAVSLFMDYLPDGHGDPFPCTAAGKMAFLFTGASTCTKLFSRSLIEALGLRFTDHAIAEDLLFTYTFLAHSRRVTAIEEALYRYDLGTGSGNEVNPRNVPVLVDAFSLLKQRLESDGLFDAYRDAYTNLTLGHFDNMFQAARDADELAFVFDAVSGWLRDARNADLAEDPIDFASDRYAELFSLAAAGNFTRYLAFSYNDLKQSLAQERRTTEELRGRLEAAEARSASALAEADALRSSNSFKVGNLLMKVPSKAKQALKKP